MFYNGNVFNGKVYFSEAEWSSNLILDLLTDSAQGLRIFVMGHTSRVNFTWPVGWEKTFFQI